MLLSILALAPFALPLMLLVAAAVFSDRLNLTQLELWMVAGGGFVCLAGAAACFAWARRKSASTATQVVVIVLLAGITHVGMAGLLVVRYAKDLQAALPAPPPIGEGQWLELVGPDKRFRIDFPGVPEQRQEAIPGRNEPATAFGIDLKNRAFVLIYTDIPPHEMGHLSLEQRFRGARDGMLQKAPNAQLAAERDVSLDAFPGREFLMTAPTGDIVSRVYAVENRVFILLAMGRGYRSDSADVKRYFESFRLKLPPVASPTSFAGLLGSWSFDEADAQQAHDGSGGANHARIVNGTPGPGKRGKGIQIQDGHVDLGTSSRFNFKSGAAFTVAAWCKIDFGSRGPLFRWRGAQNLPTRFEFGAEEKAGLTAAVILPDKNESTNMVFASTHHTLEDTLWHHFAVARQPDGTLTIYLDGKRTGQSDKKATGAIKTDDRKFGTGFRGTLDEICVFNRALAEQEIAALAGTVDDFEDRPLPPLPPGDDKEDPEPASPFLGRFYGSHAPMPWLCFLPDGRHLIGGVQERFGWPQTGIVRWDLELLKQPPKKDPLLFGPADIAVQQIAGHGPILLADEGRKLLAPSQGGTAVVLYDTATLTPLPMKFEAHQGNPALGFMSLSGDESHLLVTDWPKNMPSSIRKYDFKTGKLLATWGPFKIESHALVAPNNECFVMASREGVKIGSMATGKVFREYFRKYFRKMTFTPQGHLLFTPNPALLDMTTFRLITDAILPPEQHEHVVFTPNGRYMISGGGKGEILAWDVDRKMKWEWNVGGNVRALAISPDGLKLAVSRAPSVEAMTSSITHISLYDLRLALQMTDADVRDLALRPKVAPLPDRYKTP